MQYVLSGMGKSDIPQVNLLMFAVVSAGVIDTHLPSILYTDFEVRM